MIERPQQNEQWKLEGNCTKCRRQNYCSKPCTSNKRAYRGMMRAIVADSMNRATGGAMKHIIDKTVRDYV